MYITCDRLYYRGIILRRIIKSANSAKLQEYKLLLNYYLIITKPIIQYLFLVRQTVYYMYRPKKLEILQKLYKFRLIIQVFVRSLVCIGVVREYLVQRIMCECTHYIL